jgi:Protein of unknown function (DUF3551)
MRTALTVVLTMIALVVVDIAEAKAAPWCAVYGFYGTTNCGFYSRQQCQAAISGNGGYCTPNYAGGAGSDKASRTRYR